MLDKIRFHGFDVAKSSLTINDFNSEGGRYKINFSAHEVSPQTDEDGSWLFIEVTPEVVGYSNADAGADDEANKLDDSAEESEAFIANASLILTFQCDMDDELSEDFYNQNQWYFDNYVYICTKITFEKLFANSVLDTISLPWSPRFRPTNAGASE
ncbi:hypothetical protein F3J38_00230 [Pantoea sp. Acro-805]|jgi:hypothetical protein|uniref:Uncharacterized protein n=1 Tax=Candidatus Pantoea formicae TaxID=2608355 RepID=A0ABX0QQ16_9GAMM|nr:hypothetical protein [Pantoea formicae]NIE98500.1 hypothetical protein [Pantoea formicae]